MEFFKCMQEKAEEFDLELNNDQLEKFNIYYNVLIEWNKKMNLTAITAPVDVAVKHMIDSLSVCDDEIIKTDSKIIDIGTGAGFPGIPLKIKYPHIKLTLLDSLNKRIKFLQNAVEAIGFTDIEFIHGRAEEIARQKKYREKYDISLSRAVARMPILCEYALPFVKQGGFFAALKGKVYKEEIEEAKNALNVLGGKIYKVKSVSLPGIEDVRAIIYINKINVTPALYPRKAGTPERNPL
ncbi:16S rRNA (guanine(527)-N(7))-methyltransferase RsmG [Pectinatus sottacetonis]|uniref:16S rRNA (guanine(527)-N(7))-methyltransferase RsmG n=1 Tax=Pectinatus sottacetonis TaxID=1002795 RepID=UPI0018C6E09E|nr:16S rRNA (guanine(527)-N(7))-methyltransferase RsmG [Pectinatus sottacetonis]